LMSGTLETLVYTFFPVRSFQDAEYWSHSDWFWRDHHALVSPLSLALGVLLALALAPRWRLALVFVATVLATTVFQVVRYPGSMRHWGHQFMLFIGLCWIA